METQSNSGGDGRLLWSLKQAAQALSLSERTVWSMVNVGSLPHLRIGRRLLFSRAAIQLWIDQQQQGGPAAGGK